MEARRTMSDSDQLQKLSELEKRAEEADRRLTALEQKTASSKLLCEATEAQTSTQT